MDLNDLIGKHIEYASVCPEIDAIFLIDHAKGICALQADDTQATGNAIARFVSVKGAEHLCDAKVTAIQYNQPPLEKANGENFKYIETHFDTGKGRCTITTALIRGEPKASAPLILLPYKGYPPLTAFHLIDFARTAIPEQLHGTAICAEESMRTMQDDLRAKK